MLYNHLYAMKCQSFIECCKDAMDLDDNFDDSEDTTSESTRSEVRPTRRSANTETTASTEMGHDQIIETILRRLGQTYRPPMRQNPPTVGPYKCGICGHPHRTEDYSSYMQLIPKSTRSGVRYANGTSLMGPKITSILLD